MMSENDAEASLIRFGYEIQHETGSNPVLCAHKRAGKYDIDVRVQFAPVNVQIRGKNGCSLKYIVEDQNAIERSIEALRAIEGGMAFSQIWQVLH
jgi:hypothetical protein